MCQIRVGVNPEFSTIMSNQLEIISASLQVIFLQYFFINITDYYQTRDFQWMKTQTPSFETKEKISSVENEDH